MDILAHTDEPRCICSGYPMDIISADITGVAEALQNLTELGATELVIKATVALSEAGFVSVQDAIAFGEIKDDSLAGMAIPRSPLNFFRNTHFEIRHDIGKLKGLFGGSSSLEDTSSESETVAREAETSSAAPSATAVAKKTPQDNTIPLGLKINLSSVPPMSVPEKRAARDRQVNSSLLKV